MLGFQPSSPLILYPSALQNPSNVPVPGPGGGRLVRRHGDLHLPRVPQEWLLHLAQPGEGGQTLGVSLKTLDLQDLGFQEMLLVKATEGGLVESSG